MTRLNRYLLFTIIVPVIFMWSVNILVLDDYSSRIFKYWNLTYISIIGLILFAANNQREISIILSSKEAIKKIIFALGLLFLTQLIATFSNNDLNLFSVKQFIQSVTLYLVAILSLLFGFISVDNKANYQELKNFALLGVGLSIIFFFIEFSENDILYILTKRPFALSFYFIPILTFLLLYGRTKMVLLISSLIWLSFIMIMSGSRSGTLVQLALTFGYFFKSRSSKLALLLIALLLFFFTDFNWLFQTRITNLETSRTLIWREVLLKINESQNYIIGNGFVKSLFSTANENISTAHNTFLQLIYSTGIVGLLIGIFIIFKLFFEIRKVNLLFAISLIAISWHNDFSIFPIDYSRLFEYIFFNFFLGALLHHSKWKDQF